MNCPKCLFDNPDETRSCRRCGAVLSAAAEEAGNLTDTFEIHPYGLSSGSLFADRYQVIEEIGKGGMGRVYKVHDREIDDKIALKLLKPEISSDKETIRRFRNEMKYTRKIIHRNICRTYDMGKAGDSHFITMEYVSGEDLKSLIRRIGPLPITKALFIAGQICEGLAEAHRRGIVHRDLKSQNVMIDREGNVRIMDFGIAKAQDAEGITTSGVVIGTAEYMSPEQVDGKDIDQRSDIYSLGVVLFEMLTGKIPFEGKQTLEIAFKHKTEIPTEPRKLNPDIPEKLNRLVLQCLEKDPAKRYQNALELLHGLDDLGEPFVPVNHEAVAGPVFTAFPRRITAGWAFIRKKRIPQILAGFLIGGWLALQFVHRILIDRYGLPETLLNMTSVTIFFSLAAALIWSFSKVPKTAKRRRPVILLLTLVLMAGVFLNIRLAMTMLKKEGGNKIPWKDSLAILPFRDLSQDRGQDWLCDAVTDNLITKLSGLGNVKVTSKYSSDRFRNSNKSLAEVGRVLSVAKILEGSLQIEKNTIRINVRLQDAPKEFSIWSQTYEQKMEGYFRLVDRITNSIASELKLRLTGRAMNRIRRRDPKSLEALNNYLLGRQYEQTYRESRIEGDFDKAVDSYKKAIAGDSTYALAYWNLGNIFEARFARKGEKADLETMLRHYREAYEIEPELPETNLGQGWTFFYGRDFDMAYQYFKKAFEIDPNQSEVNYEAGAFFRSLGLYERAIECYLRAIELNPMFIQNYSQCATCYLFMGESEKAVLLLRRAIAIDPDNAGLHFNCARQLLMMGNTGEAEKEIALAESLDPSSLMIPRHKAWLLAVRGDREGALALIRGLPALAYDVSCIYAILGMNDQAIRCIEEGIEKGFEIIKEHPFSYPFLAGNPFFLKLRNDLRFADILRNEKEKYEEKLRRFPAL